MWRSDENTRFHQSGFATSRGDSIDAQELDLRRADQGPACSVVPAAEIELRKVFNEILFDYIFCNGDAHLKNFSVYESALGDYVMTPAYDLLNTFLHYPGDLTFLALSLFKGDFMTREFETLGYYTEADFILLARSYALKENEVLNRIRLFKRKAPDVERMVRESLLTPPAQEEYLRLFHNRLNAFRAVR